MYKESCFLQCLFPLLLADGCSITTTEGLGRYVGVSHCLYLFFFFP